MDEAEYKEQEEQAAVPLTSTSAQIDLSRWCFVILAFHRSIPKGVFPSKAFHLLAEYGSLQCSQYVTDGERAGRRPSSASPGYYQLLPQDIKATTLKKPRSIWVSNSTNSNGWAVMLSQARTSRVLTSADVWLQPEELKETRR